MTRILALSNSMALTVFFEYGIAYSAILNKNLNW